MNLKSIFDKAVDRPIEGVIKADDEASLKIEVEEYVLTNEIEKRLEAFLSAYNEYSGANGVWISGFFGSGKSHLLKMLALLLENRKVEGTKCLDLFLPKCKDNPILQADLKKAVNIPSKSILFNIDQKSDVISKGQLDALLAVFVKVFDDMCGYYGKQAYIAQFERDLDHRDLYQKFKDSYQEIAKKPWEQGREVALLEKANIAQAYAEVTGQNNDSQTGILDNYRADYKLSIEDFAHQVNEFISKQKTENGLRDFRLNFFVDEVGQYIADNVKLMTNLQTIAESLATKSRGQAWIIVTAQEEMDSVVGEMNRQQSNDFSKIQARFATRMKLTSTDVAEVIQKRLLSKTKASQTKLDEVYQQQSNNFKTLFDFADGSTSYRNFRDAEHFALCYPFIPYQFELFQSAIQNLSLHNAFEGKHSSVGERSMLGVFQQVVIKIGNQELGKLATFDLMFEGVRTALKSIIQKSILSAEKQLDNPFAIQLLKALFLVKYIKEFKPTVRNLCVLMTDDLNVNVSQLKQKVEEALGLLESQTFVQRNGEYFEYLTDEEKDVEQEIKNTDIEISDVINELKKIVFDQVIKNRKIRYPENNQDYSFTKKIDGSTEGREYELAIHIISPWHENTDNIDLLRAQNFATDELLVVMPSNERLVSELGMYLKTDKYIRQNMSNSQKESNKRIIFDRGQQNQKRIQDLQSMVKSLLGESIMLSGGSVVEVTSTDAQTRIIQGFAELISKVYPNLVMLSEKDYKEDMVKLILSNHNSDMFSDESTHLPESEQEMLAFINQNVKANLRTTVKTLLEKFERKPYGWYHAGIICNLASLCARGKVEARLNEPLDNDGLASALLNSKSHENLILEPQTEFTASQIRGLKDFYEDMFDQPPKSSDARELAEETKDQFTNRLSELQNVISTGPEYPFEAEIKEAIEQYRDVQKKPYDWFLTQLMDTEDSLITLKENLIDPVLSFVNGSQNEIFQSAEHFIKRNQSNFRHIESELISELKQNLNDPKCFKNNLMSQVKKQHEALESLVSQQVNSAKTMAKSELAELKHKITQLPEYQSLPEARQKELVQPFELLNREIDSHNSINEIVGVKANFENKAYGKILNRLNELDQLQNQPPQIKESAAEQQENQPEQTPSHPPQPMVMPLSQLKVEFDMAWLDDEADVEKYSEAMKAALLAAINSGKRIQV